MIRDLNGAGQLEAKADVLVIGAGTIGMVLATELAARGKRVICLESGGREQEDDTHPLNATEQTGTPYAGAELGRYRCLGGTSTRWGGALIPFQAPDMSNAEWPIEWAELAPYIPDVETLFGLPPGPYDEPSIRLGDDYIARLAKWPSFAKRNVYSLLREKVDAAEGPEIWINATATRFTVEGGRLTRVSAHSPDGSSIEVSAKENVISAGAIESTRILFLVSQQNPGALTGSGLGEGFHDHLSAVVAELEISDRSKLNQIVGFRFLPGGGMRNLRFEIAPTGRLRNTLSPCFAHIGFSETFGGFAALRDLYRALQRRRLPKINVLVQMVADLPWLARAVWWRFVHRRLLFPAKARIELHMVIEQNSVPENSIGLSEKAMDMFGQPLAKIDWKVRPEDVANMSSAITAFEKSWATSPLASLAKIRRRPITDIANDMTAGGGIYHPGGSTKMVTSPEQGPINRDLGVFGLSNLAVCATSVLPTGGGANPTMMLMLMAMRYVRKLTSEVEVAPET